MSTSSHTAIDSGHQRERRRPKDSLSKPPRLNMRLWAKFKFLLLANIIPIGAVAWLGFKFARGEVGLNPNIDSGSLLPTLALILISCICIGVSSWFIMPIARWLRDYPSWCMQHRNRVLWALPCAGGYLIWALCGLMTILMSMLAIAVIIIGLARLFMKADAVEQPAEATAIQQVLAQGSDRC